MSNKPRDACSSMPCKNHGTCVPQSLLDEPLKDESLPLSTGQYKSYKCECLPFYVGEHCETEEDDCLMNSTSGAVCLNGGTCMNGPGLNNYECRCSLMYTGPRCETKLTACSSYPCLYRGLCILKESMNETERSMLVDDKLNSTETDADSRDFVCVCQPGYNDRFCQHELGVCDTVRCENGAQCQSLLVMPDGQLVRRPSTNNDTYMCKCTSYFTGTKCELQKLVYRIVRSISRTFGIAAAINLFSLLFYVLAMDLFKIIICSRVSRVSRVGRLTYSTVSRKNSSFEMNGNDKNVIKHFHYFAN
jgi:hypothetical protein